MHEIHFVNMYHDEVQCCLFTFHNHDKMQLETWAPYDLHGVHDNYKVTYM